jgi:hypothetical protein
MLLPKPFIKKGKVRSRSRRRRKMMMEARLLGTAVIVPSSTFFSCLEGFLLHEGLARCR